MLTKEFLLILQVGSDSLFRIIQKLIELIPRESLTLGSPLNFNIITIVQHDNVHIDFCFYVFIIFEIKKRTPFKNTDTDGSKESTDRKCFESSFS